MDTLIELIVRALIALFAGTSQKKSPPMAPKAPSAPQRPSVPTPAQRRQDAKRRAYTAVPPMRRSMIGRPPAARAVSLPPPIPRPAAAPPKPKPAPAPPPAAAPISAAAIRQLMMSRRTALRTIYVLSEVIQPPLALRQDQ